MPLPLSEFRWVELHAPFVPQKSLPVPPALDFASLGHFLSTSRAFLLFFRSSFFLSLRILMILEIPSRRTQIPFEQLQLRLISQQMRVRGWGLAANAVLCLKHAKKSNYTSVRYQQFSWPPCVADADIIFCSRGFFFFLWPPYGTGQAIIFLSCGFFFYLFSRLFSAVADWMSTILPHMVWP